METVIITNKDIIHKLGAIIILEALNHPIGSLELVLKKWKSKKELSGMLSDYNRQINLSIRPSQMKDTEAKTGREGLN